MKRILCFLGSVCVIVSLLLAFNRFAAEAASPASIKWRMQVSIPVTAPQYKYYKEFSDEISSRSKGRLKIDLYPSYGLDYKRGDSLLAVSEGLVEAVQDYGSHWVGIVPILGAGNLPLFYNNDEDHAKVLQKILRPVYEKELDKKNCKLLVLEGFPLTFLFSRKPIVNVQQLKGKKIRVSAKPVAEALSRMGVSTQAISLSEAIAALQTGVLDGQVWSMRAALIYKIHDVVHYSSPWPFYGVENIIMVNKNVFQNLPKDLQQIVEAVSQDVEKKLIQNVLLGGEGDIVLMKKTGKMNFVNLEKGAIEAARSVSKPVWDSWAKQVGPIGAEIINEANKLLGR